MRDRLGARGKPSSTHVEISERDRRLEGLPALVQPAAARLHLLRPPQLDAPGRVRLPVPLLFLSCLMGRLALRRDELRRLQIKDIDLAAGTVSVHGKGGKRATVPIVYENVRELIYLHIHGEARARPTSSCSTRRRTRVR